MLKKRIFTFDFIFIEVKELNFIKTRKYRVYWSYKVFLSKTKINKHPLLNTNDSILTYSKLPCHLRQRMSLSYF